MSFLVVVVPDYLKNDARVVTIDHGEDQVGKNFVALLEGSLCGCDWCKELENRIQSRTVPLRRVRRET